MPLPDESDRLRPSPPRGAAAWAETDADERTVVPVLRPRLPTADQLLPYLRRIDASRIYSNAGPLVVELEQRLARVLGLAHGGVASASSGTAALVGAILAVAGRATAERPFALMPSYTFVATAVAAEQCGYRVLLADVDADTWALDPAALAADPMLARVGVVLPVAPYGVAIPQARWQVFQAATGIPVVIDAAAGLETVLADPDACLGPLPVVLSFHATKSFATGEGGCVITTDAVLQAPITRAMNFGFHFSRNSQGASINGKMCEYNAALGLAELDGWDDKRAAFAAVAARYRDAFAAVGADDRLVVAPRIGSCYALLECRDTAESARVQASLERDRIEYRHWYGLGLHGHRHLEHADRLGDLATTDSLAPCLLGLPMAPDLDAACVRRVAAAVAAGLDARPA